MENIQNLNLDKIRLRDPTFIANFAKEIFIAADEDNSGYIDSEELIKFITHYSVSTGMRIPTKKEMDKIIKTFDVNNDGKISLSEFTSFMKLVFELLANNM